MLKKGTVGWVAQGWMPGMGGATMKTQELQGVMACYDVFDNALRFHAYKPYMRDYELIVEVHVGPAEPGTYSYLFRYCVEAHIRTSVADHVYRQSLDDRLTEYDSGKDLDGYVWGVNWSLLYPGWTLHLPSERAARWTERVGVECHEVQIESNAYDITLIFADLLVTKLSDGIDSGINRAYIPLR
jgi:hypothetical protein